MKVYEIMQRLVLREAEEASGYADQYLARLKEGHAEAEVSAKLSQRAFQNAAALRIVIAEMPVEIAGREV
jgi:hypothetical protein